MTLSPTPSQPTDGDCRWMLWVDGCGGFLVVTNNDVRIGREVSAAKVDVSLIADVPRLAGTIVRDEADYYWQSSVERKWIEPGRGIDGLGSAKLRLSKPSALCNSAVLTLDPPHRFGGHIDAVLLVDQTWLIGPSDDCHIRCRSLSSPLVVSRSSKKDVQTWWIKHGFGGAPKELPIGRQITVGDPASTEITMMLESIGPSRSSEDSLKSGKHDR
ncbi:hypothetical protein LF1_40650 [Rubripirellula obstinata]|uniref:Uncharacterized protein n=1 Tax=Rubripirellula obstinata TaxID=406547 RepID=A0A5B1CNJ9_9BACT|nr:hypothetical protein [Rubripirellula obstinata]KAA1261515.1 hypothetical protein LF1_40650 [Rubripirellula obstinata]